MKKVGIFLMLLSVGLCFAGVSDDPPGEEIKPLWLILFLLGAAAVVFFTGYKIFRKFGGETFIE